MSHRNDSNRNFRLVPPEGKWCGPMSRLSHTRKSMSIGSGAIKPGGVLSCKREIPVLHVAI